MKKRILAIVLTLLMLLPVVPMGVSAAGEAFIVSGGEIGKDYTYAGGVLTVLTSTAITVKNEDPSVATTDHIVVKKDISANITLAGVNISTGSNSPFSPFTIEDDSTGDVTVTLAENSVNSLTSNHIYFAGLQKNGGGADIGKLTITGTGKLTAYASYDAAGIGSFYQFNVSNITISGGVIEATGSNAGAGIGSGGSTNDSGFYASNITITGGTVTAQSSGRGAGIGGGFSCDGSNITISGGTVTATSKGGAGIGGGYQGVGSNITISGGVVNATGGDNGAAGIGGGSQGNGSNITISGGTVTATSNEEGAGIGGGAQGVGSNITISGGTVTANGGKNGAGIGGGAQGNGSNITISGGTVTAKGGSHGAGIGGGEKLNGSNITISGGVVKATGGDNGAAGIGGGLEGDGSNITISGGTVTATSNKDGAGIGGGLRGDGSNITISGGTVTAQSSEGGAGIGGGRTGRGSNITISGGSVHAIGDKAGIGGGYGAVTPKNGDDEDVYLMTIPNPSTAKVYIDNAEYKPSNHSSIDKDDTNLYAYVTGAHHTVKVGTETSCYHFVNNAFVKCTLKSDYSTDTAGNHWFDCTDENCGVQHDFAQHTFNQVVDSELKTGVAANCQHGTEYYKSCICGAKGTEKFYGTDVDSSNHVGTLGDWQMTDSEHWKEYSECGCKEYESVHKDENPFDHKCDDCEKILSEHELNDHPEYKANCTHNGMIAYYSCMHCGKLFADENAENEITGSDIIVPATGHSYENGECVNCGARDPEISKVRAFFLDIFKLIIRIIKDFPVWIKTLPEAFIGLFR